MLNLLAALALVSPSLAQEAGQPWGVIETEHFRLHYPVVAEAWALETGQQMESIRTRVAEEVGYEPDRVIDIVLMDPYTQANGFALPTRRGPRMGLFSSPPSADSVLGSYRSWEEDLVTHEDAHLVHLLRPSRNPVARALVSDAMGVGPISRKSPRWVAEGYATVVEGRLTGFGRPNSDGRATILRTMASEGRMPLYGELDGSREWMGFSHAYLVGSAYLEWLEERYGEGTLRQLWTAMSAVSLRSFDEDFELVFGDSPQALYERFVAEVSHSAVELEALRPPAPDTLWQRFEWYTGAPAISPDGSKIAVVRATKLGTPKLVVLSAGDWTEERAEWVEARDERLAKDPEDIPGAEPLWFEREPETERVRPDRVAQLARWMPDGQSILFTAWMRADDGRLVPDLVIWDTKGGERRVTHEASVGDADPDPTGTYAVAIRQAWSVSQLVRIDLATGEQTSITEPDVNAVYSGPRISPDGQRIAFVRNLGAGWELMLKELSSGVETRLPIPDGALPTAPAWAPDGSLLASIGDRGFVEVWRYFPDGQPPVRMTQTRGGALSPAAHPDGSLFFLSAASGGIDLHRQMGAAWVSEVELGALHPIIRPPAPEPVPPPDRQVVVPEDVVFGRQHLSMLAGVTVGRDGSHVDLGAKMSDYAGRSTLIVAGAWGEAATGAALGWGIRVRPQDLIVRAWGLTELTPTETQRFGGSFTVQDQALWHQGGVAGSGGVWVDAPWGTDTLGSRQVVWAELDASQAVWFGRPWIGLDATFSGHGGLTEGESWARARGSAQAWLGLGPAALRALGSAGRSTGSGRDLFTWSGPVPSMMGAGTTSERVVAPLLSSGLRAQRFAQTELGVGVPGLEVQFVQSRLFDLEQPSRASWAALALDTGENAAQPIFKLVPMSTQLGVGCVLETPAGGWDDKPCASKEDWGAWLNLTWRP